MTVASCPRCREDVTIPAGASRSAKVRCPLCQDEYSLSDALAGVPPELIVLDEPDSPGEYTLAGHETRSSAPAFDYDRGSAAASRPRTGTAAAGARPRSKPKQGNPVWTIAGVVLGGLAALPLAQLVLWWLPGDWQRDPFEFGPAVGKYAPWIVPSNYRPKAVEDGSDESSDTPSSAKNNPNNKPQSAGRTESITLLGADEPAPFGRPEDETENSAGLDDVPVPSVPPPVDNAEGKSPPTNPKTNKRPPKNAPLAIDKTANEPKPGDPDYVGLMAAGSTSAGDLSAAIQGVVDANQAWSDAQSLDNKNRGQAARNLYAAFAHLSEVISFVDTKDPAVLEEAEVLHNMLRSFGTNAELFKLLGAGANNWISKPEQRTNRGVLLAGTVTEIVSQPPFYESKIELSSAQKTTVSVLGWIQPPEAYQPGRNVLILGVYVDDPAKNLSGYKGDLPEVICGGFLVTIPKDSQPDEPQNVLPEESPPADSADAEQGTG